MGKNMGKRGKKQKQSDRRRASQDLEQDDFEKNYQQTQQQNQQDPDTSHSSDNEHHSKQEFEANPCSDMPSKFTLYQQSVQSPKGDISYLLKFFMMYVGGRAPLHLQEDFCGTALLSTEWIRNDPRRTAVGLDLDLEALNWCLENNTSKIGEDGYLRMSLFHGNVLQPRDAKLVKFEIQDLIRNVTLKDSSDSSESVVVESSNDELVKRNFPLPSRDIVCAFNYSCCCLHERKELLLYFKHVLIALSKRGGIFVMDLYGGTSSERELKLQRKFPNFTYVWEQAPFDIIGRKTRISLHFHLQNPHRRLRHAFSYSWRLWTLPEIKDCMEEAGFQSVHFWIREMPDTEEIRSSIGFGAAQDIKYEEAASFQQEDSWNAYVVGVA